MIAVLPYQVQDTNLLTFPKDAVITLSTSKKMDPGWLYGAYDGKTGSFPIDYVAPILGQPTPAAIAQAKEMVRISSHYIVLCHLLSMGDLECHASKTGGSRAAISKGSTRRSCDFGHNPHGQQKGTEHEEGRGRRGDSASRKVLDDAIRKGLLQART